MNDLILFIFGKYYYGDGVGSKGKNRDVSYKVCNNLDKL